MRLSRGNRLFSRFLAHHHRIERGAHTNPKRERGMPQVTCGAAPVPSLTLRASMCDASAAWVDQRLPNFLVVFSEKRPIFSLRTRHEYPIPTWLSRIWGPMIAVCRFCYLRMATVRHPGPGRFRRLCSGPRCQPWLSPLYTTRPIRQRIVPEAIKPGDTLAPST
jgi:hypothetical protein